MQTKRLPKPSAFALKIPSILLTLACVFISVCSGTAFGRGDNINGTEHMVITAPCSAVANATFHLVASVTAGHQAYKPNYTADNIPVDPSTGEYVVFFDDHSKIDLALHQASPPIGSYIVTNTNPDNSEECYIGAFEYNGMLIGAPPGSFWPESFGDNDAGIAWQTRGVINYGNGSVLTKTSTTGVVTTSTTGLLFPTDYVPFSQIGTFRVYNGYSAPQGSPLAQTGTSTIDTPYLGWCSINTPYYVIRTDTNGVSHVVVGGTSATFFQQDQYTGVPIETGSMFGPNTDSYFSGQVIVAPGPGSVSAGKATGGCAGGVATLVTTSNHIGRSNSDTAMLRMWVTGLPINRVAGIYFDNVEVMNAQTGTGGQLLVKYGGKGKVLNIPGTATLPGSALQALLTVGRIQIKINGELYAVAKF